MSGKILIIPTALALDMQFPARTIRLYLLLQSSARHKDEEGNLVNLRDRGEIAAELKSSYVTVCNALLNLQKAGWVRIDRIPNAYGRQVTLFETQQPPTTKPSETGRLEESHVPAEN
jgi:hypothetical protein